MDDNMIESADFGSFEIARRLEAYADQRLSPSVAATTRMRTIVMNAAHRRAALIKADATFDAAGATTSARAAQRAAAERIATQHAAELNVTTLSPWRRPVAAVMAGCLTVALLAGTALAAEPGGPLYAIRIWTETATLPGNLADRAQAEIVRLQDRLDEAQRASAAGDVFGTKAALAAYSTIVVEAANGSDGDPAASAAIASSIHDQMATLRRMLEDLPGPARAAAQAALSSSATALDTLGGPSRDGGGGLRVGAPGSGATGSPRPDKPATGSGSPKSTTSGNAGGPAKTSTPVKSDPPKNDNTVKDHQPASPSPHASAGHGTGSQGKTVQDRP